VVAGADGAVAPSRDDAVVAASSQAIGGPLGVHARPHPWWTPLRSVLALVTLAGVLNLVHTAPCQSGAWWDGSAYADLCYSDIPLSYVVSGAGEGLRPYADGAGRYPPTADPAPVVVLAWAAAGAARVLTDTPDVGDRAEQRVAELARAPSLHREAVTYYAVYALAMIALMLALVALLLRLSGRRPWDAAAFALAPVLILAATIGWDLLGVTAAIAAVAVWSSERPIAAGVLLGTAVAAAVWPVAVLVALLPLAVRARQPRGWLAVTGVTSAVWALWQVPVLLLARDSWWGTVNHTLTGQVGYGSLWRLAAAYGRTAAAPLLVVLVVLGMALVVLAVLGLALGSQRQPRLPQVVVLLLIGGLVVWPVYSPQYVLWLLPFAVLARPRWRDLLIWQAGEVFYFLAIWWTLAGATADAGVDDTYAVAIAVRVAAELWLAGVVVRDILRPEHDPVRADLVTDDPAGGVLAERRPRPRAT